ncbi:unnamed protein product [Calicophoron daubneyi]|uniref:Uncharacterized protein n=1 Tax=Calicophoron daubneyi TaxID=300641 RepID=A0AAV2T6F6_CALDB
MMASAQLDEPIKQVIRRIVFCTGEPYAVSDEVVELLYAYLNTVVDRVTRELGDARPDLTNILLLVCHQPRVLTRVVDYFRILAGGVGSKPVEGDTLAEITDGSENAWNHLLELCAKLQIEVPDSETVDNPAMQNSPLAIGRQFRLARIDSKTMQMTVQEYLDFTKLRQTATLLSLARPLRRSFWKWVFCRSSSQSQRDELPADNSATEISCSFAPEIRQGMKVLAHLLTYSILDVIDLALFLRRKIGISLTSPLTPVEIKQSMQRFKPIPPL